MTFMRIFLALAVSHSSHAIINTSKALKFLYD